MYIGQGNLDGSMDQRINSKQIEVFKGKTSPCPRDQAELSWIVRCNSFSIILNETCSDFDIGHPNPTHKLAIKKQELKQLPSDLWLAEEGQTPPDPHTAVGELRRISFGSLP